MRAQEIPDNDSDIFGSRVKRFELSRIQVEITVVKTIVHLLLNNIFQNFGIDDIAGYRINFARYFNFEHIIVTMVTGVVAQTKQRFVFLIAESGVMQTVGSIKMGFSEN